MCTKCSLLTFVYCSHTLRPPQKRKSTSTDGSNEKVARIKTEDGIFVSLTVQEDEVDLTFQSSEKANTADKSPSHGKTGASDSEKDSSKTENNASMSETSDSTAESVPSPEDKLSDKNKGSKEEETSGTNDTALDQNRKKDKLDISDDESKEESKDKEDDKEKGSGKTESTCSSGSTDYKEIKEDIKPDKKELDKKLNDTKVEDNDTNDEKKVFVHKAAQTVPTVVKFASPEEVDLLKLCPVEQKQALLEKSRELDDTKKELGDTQKTLKSLQGNIWQLLKIIVPDFDYGEPENIEKVILDFIRANGDQIDNSSSSDI